MSDIRNLKNVGMIQNNFMWQVSIPIIPYLGVNNLLFQMRSTTIPGKTINHSLVRYLNQQYTLPAGVEFEPEWTASVFLSETHQLYNLLLKWASLVPEMSYGLNVNTIKTDANIKLLSLNRNIINKRFKLTGIYPGAYPEIPDLNMENAEGLITLDYVFKFDDIDYDLDDQLTF